MNKKTIPIGLVFVLSVMFGFSGFAQRPLPKDSHTKSSGTSADRNGLSFTYSSDLPNKLLDETGSSTRPSISPKRAIFLGSPLFGSMIAPSVFFAIPSITFSPNNK